MLAQKEKKIRLHKAVEVKRILEEMAADAFARRVVHIGTSLKTDGPLYAAFEDAADENGASMLVDFEGAFAYAAQKNKEGYLGFNDWRVPTIKELDVLHENLNLPALQGSFFEKRKCYWSCDVYETLGCAENLKSGKISYLRKPIPTALRLVRG